MFNREALKVEIEDIVRSKGLSLFDIDFPTLANPTLRVFIWRYSESAKQETALTEVESASLRRGVTLDECAAVSREISNLLDKGEIEDAAEWALEVSSPGINRRLRQPEHFRSALGERVRLKVRAGASGSSPDSTVAVAVTERECFDRTSLVGKIVEVTAENIVLQRVEERRGKGKSKKVGSSKGAPDAFAGNDLQSRLSIPFESIEEATVDFVF